MMKTLNIKLENCFGIKEFINEFSFERKPIHIIYAPNGTMKTSFAKTMKCLSGQSKEEPLDQLHEDRVARLEVKSDNVSIAKESVFVVNGDYDIDSSNTFVNFLASNELKERYETIYKKLIREKDLLITKLRSCSQSSDCESEILYTFLNNSDDTIFTVLERIAQDIKNGSQLFEFRYNDVFDTKGYVKTFVDTYKDSLKKYIDKYEELLRESSLFRSIDGHNFGTYQASELSKYVSDGVFFGVKHKIVLQDGTEIKSQEQLDKIISDEKDKILSDSKLKKTFEKITKAIDKNTDLRGFKEIIEKHPDWIIEIIKYDEFRKKVWLGYISKEDVKPLFDSYIKVYAENKNELIDVLKQASAQQDKWKQIISLYNDRFHVPIKVEIENQRDIILKSQAAKLQFYYIDDNQVSISINKKKIESVLSRGEKRAFTILQFIFEVESRKNVDDETLLIMDDIADSFDYQNKYAIIEYIKDLVDSDSKKFYMLVLTHNFDFYRTVSSRLGLNSNNLWMVERNVDGTIIMNPGQYKGNVYENAFVGKDSDNKIFISMIPFVRNLIEYTEGTGSQKYIILTECLHQKRNSKFITENQIIEILDGYTLGKGIKRHKSKNSILELIMNTAQSISDEEHQDYVKIENKIVLSIAIRHLAEKYMHDQLINIGKDEQDLEVSGNQTGKWTKMYKECCPNDQNINIIERVNMMTPELIHINSFMFEPLIDMSTNHLIKLYKDCKRSFNLN